MRTALQLLAVAAFSVFLAQQMPRKALFPRLRPAEAQAPVWASFVTLDDASYDRYVQQARMAWQVRTRVTGRLDLEADTPLREDAPPPPAPAFGAPESAAAAPLAAVPFVLTPLSPPSMAAGEATPLPQVEDRRRRVLLDLSPYETLQERK